MKKHIIRLFSVVLVLSLFLTAFSVDAALSKNEILQKIDSLDSKNAQLQSDIKKLQGQINQQQAIKAKLEQKIANIQRQIDICNSEINSINAEIAKNNKEIAADRLAYKKRLRAIQMSNSGNDLQIILGAENFSEFLQLAQYTSSVSARDQKLIAKLEKKIEANEKLLKEQVEVKKTVTKKQNELQAENREIQAVISKISGNKSQLQSDKDSIQKQLKKYNDALKQFASNTGGVSFYVSNLNFSWPTPGYYGISAGWQSNDSVHNGRHFGIDIAGGGIAEARIIAMADGVVTGVNNSCNHNYGKYGNCCGNGYGNYVNINHGRYKGDTYTAIYAHMSRAAVSNGQRVKKGQTIGYVGTTGWSTGYHLHLGIAVNGGWRNPMNFFRRVG